MFGYIHLFNAFACGVCFMSSLVQLTNNKKLLGMMMLALAAINLGLALLV